jgi:hypothetical protein
VEAYVLMYAHTHIHADTRIHTHIRAHALIHVHTHTLAHSDTQHALVEVTGLFHGEQEQRGLPGWPAPSNLADIGICSTPLHVPPSAHSHTSPTSQAVGHFT